ncbi:hypothetical protein GF385_04635 [Candidatus Dependentiae bacterium]|nr:hypothetical protein [Candidatus Dependentiae bacterium]
MSDKRIQKILEQTDFLVEKQKELFKFVSEVYSNILNNIEEKISKESDESILDDLKSIKEKISEHSKKLSEQIKEDIDFLGEQQKAITQIKDMQDKDKAAELLNMLVEKDEKLLDTQEFKQQVEQDLLASTNELKAMEQDLLNSLKENKIRELKLMLEAVQEHEKDIQDEECKPQDCSSCSGCASSQGSDIFEFFKEQSEETNNEEIEDKNEEKK